MARITRATTVRRWKGDLTDVANVARLVAELTTRRDENAGPVGRTPDLRVEYTDGEDAFESPGEFERGISSSELPKVQSIRIDEGSAAGSTLRVSVRFTAAALGDAVAATVIGHEPTAVEGARSRIARALQPGRRRAARFANGGTALSLFLLAFGCIVGSMADVLLLRQHLNDMPVLAEVFFWAGVIALLLAAASAIAAWLVPKLELLPTGADTRWRRWRGVAVAAFVLPLPAALLPLLLTRAS